MNEVVMLKNAKEGLRNETPTTFRRMDWEDSTQPSVPPLEPPSLEQRVNARRK